MLEVVSIIGVLSIGVWFLTKIDNRTACRLPEYMYGDKSYRIYEHHSKFPLIGEKGFNYVDETNSIFYYWREPYYHSYLEYIANEVTPVYHPYDEHIVLSNQDGVIRINNSRTTLRDRLNQISEQH